MIDIKFGKSDLPNGIFKIKEFDYPIPYKVKENLLEKYPDGFVYHRDLLEELANMNPTLAIKFAATFWQEIEDELDRAK
ncbi:MAG: hypothetical protein A2042_02150 [Candidatus Schekmanbacteria bacterium GWA2_38_11]|uniref:Uncharacterized protein n=1 Tax=Candidatus Schekmanbacteria bacterium GWA2_38_11 TaxID=1817876 RepID=A0A1F7RET9_9BACT|nr:MAG: hypothetical protein A2042_02150 [Candidatus Schekmanbacteria bacterium GWA2_38_11]